MPKKKAHIANEIYESIDEVLDRVCDKSLPNWESEHGGTLKSDTNMPSEEWCDNTTLEESIELARYGWKKGASMMTDKLELAHRSTQFERLPDYEYDVAGYIPNIPLYVSGSPTHMMSPIGNETSSKKTIEILVSLDASCGITADKMLNKGASILSLVDKLEHGGMSCHVTGCIYSNARNNGSKHYFEFPIKKAGVPMDIDRCAFALVHPALLRRIWFRVIELDVDAYRDFNSGYGIPTNVPLHMRTGKIYFPKANDFQPYSVEEGVKTAVEMYEHQIDGKDWDGLSV